MIVYRVELRAGDHKEVWRGLSSAYLNFLSIQHYADGFRHFSKRVSSLIRCVNHGWAGSLNFLLVHVLARTARERFLWVAGDRHAVVCRD